MFMEFKDYYAILGVDRNASAADIKKAYRKLVRKYHPDVSKEKNAEERTKEINEAYEVLGDQTKRSKYDQLGANWRDGQDFTPPPGWQRREKVYTSDFGNFGAGGDFSDFFESLFGGGGFGAQQRQRRSSFEREYRGAPQQQQGEDIHSKYMISLPDAFNGASHTISLPITTIDDRGQRHTQTRTLKVKIPAGITAGQQIRLGGQGNPGLNGGPPGDLYLEIDITPHPVFRIEGTDIYLNLPITPWEAALGATIAVPTLGGKVELKIPGGSRSGQKMRLKGRGLPSKPLGDQYIILQIVTPPAETPAAKKFYEHMAETFPFNPRENMGV
jgi:curved DNA-binding protein